MNSKENARKVFVTGGTGSVGQALVTLFAEKGYEIVFQYNHDAAKAKSLSLKTGATPWQVDFTRDISLPDQEFSIVINNTGVLISKTIMHEVEDDEWNNTLTVNLTAPFKIARQYLPSMVKNRWGRIINIGSIYSLKGCSNNASYNVSKHALSGLTKSIAHDYAAFGITCNEICPTAIESQIMNRLAERKEAEGIMSASEYLNMVRSNNPMKRMAQPLDVAHAALFLASDESEFVNGISLVVDGGQIT